MTKFKTFVTDFLIDSFVEDYTFNKGFVDHLNSEMQKMGIPFKYTYDDFCIELLNRTINSINNTEIKADKLSGELTEKFGWFIAQTLKDMETSKLTPSVC